jgi:hypothetical protein
MKLERRSAPQNNGMQLTSGGFERASRAASLMRRLQLIPVFCGPGGEEQSAP